MCIYSVSLITIAGRVKPRTKPCKPYEHTGRARADSSLYIHPRSCREFDKFQTYPHSVSLVCQRRVLIKGGTSCNLAVKSVPPHFWVVFCVRHPRGNSKQERWIPRCTLQCNSTAELQPTPPVSMGCTILVLQVRRYCCRSWRAWLCNPLPPGQTRRKGVIIRTAL